MARSKGEWNLRQSVGLLDAVTDEMIRQHAQRVTRIFLRGLSPAFGDRNGEAALE